MKTKTNLKFLLAFGIAFVVFLIINANSVKASYTTVGVIESGTPTETTLDVIPNTINLDIKETEFEKTGELVLNKIISSLKEQNIIVKQINENDVKENDVVVYVHTGDIRKPEVVLKKGSNEEISTKEIEVVYSNSSKYNKTDEEYIKNLLIEKKIPNQFNEYKDTLKVSNCYELENLELGNFDYFGREEVIKVLQQKVNDKSISFIIRPEMSMGDSVRFSGVNTVGYAVFKNDVFYGYILIQHEYNFKITIPDSIENTESAYTNYAIPKIQKYLNTNKNIKLEKVEGFDKYIVYVDGEWYGAGLIIQKASGTHIGSNIYVGQLEENATITVVPKENKTMEIEVKNKGYKNIIGSYELTLKGIDKLTNPIDITFYVGEEFNNRKVYILHQKQNGSYEEFERTIAKGKVTITVSELSPFILGMKEEEEKTTPTQKGEKDETPKTGVTDITYYIMVAAIISAVGIIATRKKQTK